MSKKKDRHSAALKRYRCKPVQVEDLFVRQLRILHEHQDRHEREMYREENFTPFTGNNPHNKEMGGIWNKSLAREAREMASSVSAIGQMFFKIQKEAKEAADFMSFDERVEAVCDWGRTLGKNNAFKLVQALRALEYELLDGPRHEEAATRDNAEGGGHDSTGEGSDPEFDPLSD